ncbi:CRAL/TRIO domain-containing protein, partial [Coemansia reversa NRRL 1564]
MLNGWYEWRKSANIDDLPVAQADNNLPVPYPIRGYYSVADANLTAGTLVSEVQLKLNKTFGGGCWHKRDKDGHPVYIERAGRYLMKDISKLSTMGGLFEFHFLMQEFINRTIFPECSQLAGREISQQVVVFDLAGISIGMLSHIPALNMLREMLSKDQLYYPECMYRTYIVNAPSMFVTAWKMIRSWLDPRVISKIHILSKDHTGELLKQIPAANLPSFLGGNCRCSHMPGGCVPSVPLNN